MKHLSKLALLSTLFLFFTATTLWAAFPTEKAPADAIVLNAENGINSDLIEKPATSKELKKQLKTVMHENSRSMSGGGKSKIVAALLAIFLGSLGIHSFYMGQKQKGFVQLGIFVAGLALMIAGLASFVSGMGQSIPILAIVGYFLILGVSIWALVDFVRILTGGLSPEEGFDD